MLTIVKKAITDTIETATEPQEQSKDPLPPQTKQSRRNWILVDIIVLFVKIFVSCIESLIKLILPPYEKPLYNETVLVTGSGGGIGRALAVKFALQGATVVCLDINEETNKETETLIKATGVTRVYAFTCDLSDRESVQEKYKLIEKDVGHISILVNNAGVLSSQRFSSQTSQHIVNTFNVNVFAHFWMLECVLPHMRKYNHGHIVAISSMCGVNAIPNLTAYCASKYAVTGLMEGLYEEIREENPDNQIKFTSVYPYMVDTGLIKKPKTRFPELLKLLRPEEVADHIVKAVRQDVKELSIPSHLLHTSRIFRLLPNKMVELIKDFLDTGVEPDE